MLLTNTKLHFIQIPQPFSVIHLPFDCYHYHEITLSLIITRSGITDDARKTNEMRRLSRRTILMIRALFLPKGEISTYHSELSRTPSMWMFLMQTFVRMTQSEHRHPSHRHSATLTLELTLFCIIITNVFIYVSDLLEKKSFYLSVCQIAISEDPGEIPGTSQARLTNRNIELSQ